MNERFDPTAALEKLLPQLDGSDLRAVRPFSPARRLTLAVGLFSIASAALLWQLLGWRPDHQVLGNPWLWGASAVELAAALSLLARASREAVPARSSSLEILALAAAGAAALHVAVLLATFARSQGSPAAGGEWRAGLFCFGFEVSLAAPCVLFALWLGRLGLTARPRRVGILGGVGAGLAADSVWRLICPFSDPAHTFSFHTSGILSAVVLGLLLATLWESARARACRRRGPALG